MKKIGITFILAFALNLIWENVHVVLYANYQGGTITQFILVRASLFDAFVVTLLILPFLFMPFFLKREWFVFILGTIVAVVNEWYGLSTHRWVYNALMPIVPILNVGLSPMLQLGVLGYITLKLQKRFYDNLFV